ncbi:Hypothetical Protein FCC1311_003602 [Hondaea fermentalgiana]|uniref:Protein THEM6 n=1 Tax=Hondaea fermentalgiana TaxID=2315210 RepID=A0A2R5FZG1_9STRA|nr:Hypothetical Protein FCC1311_003602 [Hondaea fermentalgiana]|eukprot:GBG24142.1 Hypothetical Protein FCC1311_003602 [Hondaea fermentalgiana]
MVFRGLLATFQGLGKRWMVQREGVPEKIEAMRKLGIETPHIYRTRAGFPALFDVDINLHLNNASFVFAAELARWQLSGQVGLVSAVVKNRWAFILGSQAFLWTVIEAIDDRWMYMTQTFTSPTASADEKPKVVYAQGLVRAIIMPPKRGMQLTPRDVLSEIGVSSEAIDRLEERKPDNQAHIQGFLHWDNAVDGKMKDFGLPSK